MSGTGITPVALVDDHTLVRTGLVGLVNRLGGYKVVLEAEDGEEFTRALATAPTIEIAIIDLNMPVMDGFATISWLHRTHPSIKSIALTFDGSEEAVIRAIRNGARSFLLKNMKPDRFKLALDRVRDTGYFANDHLGNNPAEAADTRSAYERERSRILTELTPKELAFIKLACSPAEYTYEEIAVLMDTKPSTVETHRKHVFEQFNIRSKSGLVIFAYRWGIVKVEAE
ncbi:MAG: response regulator transcription factor [Flavobacteriales bacterium]|nr:response regulator transcription factor [Flavobacteriales bacterium]